MYTKNACLHVMDGWMDVTCTFNAHAVQLWKECSQRLFVSIAVFWHLYIKDDSPKSGEQDEEEVQLVDIKVTRASKKTNKQKTVNFNFVESIVFHPEWDFWKLLTVIPKAWAFHVSRVSHQDKMCLVTFVLQLPRLDVFTFEWMQMLWKHRQPFASKQPF